MAPLRHNVSSPLMVTLGNENYDGEDNGLNERNLR